MNIYRAFLASLYPKKRRCALCGVEDSRYFCSLCASGIEFINDRKCLKCGKGLEDNYSDSICLQCRGSNFIFNTAYSSFYYTASGKELIHKIKYEGLKPLAKVLAKYMLNIIVEENIEGDVIVPVPIHKDKEEFRGFNQSYLIAEHLSRYISLPMWPALIRSKATKEQYKLDKLERKINVNNAFSPNLLYNVINKRVLLIDDVFTTGNTVNECSKVLKKSGAVEIYVITAASGINI